MKRIVTTVLITFLTACGLRAGTVYNVGPEQSMKNIHDVPWDKLQPGDEVRIHWRKEPYREKWVICARGVEGAPVTVRGIPSVDGRLPVIDGKDAVTAERFPYWGTQRSLIKIGGANFAEEVMPGFIIVDSLEVRNARPPNMFSDADGQQKSYADHAAGIHIEKGRNIIIRNCVIRDNANGFFVSRLSSDITLEFSHIFDNGLEKSIYQHNAYTEAKHMIYQFNRFDRPRDGAGGNNIKDRSAGTVIRYNWIVGGNRLLDLVESDYDFIRNDPAYRETFVYGNFMVKPAVPENNQIVHYGGDQGREEHFRKGTLWFYHNTVISERFGMTSVFRLSSQDEKVRCFNNIFDTTAMTGRLSMLHELGELYMHHNWLPYDWARFYQASLRQKIVSSDAILGEHPGFQAPEDENYHLIKRSVCVDAGAELPDQLRERYPVEYQYGKHRQKEKIETGITPNLGAFQK